MKQSSSPRGSRKPPQLLDPHDVKEVVRFQEYLRDLNSDMTHEDFAGKYCEYLGMTKTEALKYAQFARRKP